MLLFSNFLIHAMAVITFCSGAIIITDCRGQIQLRDGPGGFGHTYRPGNRVLVDKSAVKTKAGFSTAIRSSLAGELDVVVQYSASPIRGNTRVNLFAKNLSAAPVVAQLAFYKDTWGNPVGLFSLRVSPSTRLQTSTELECVDINTGVAEGVLTVQGHNPPA